MADVLDAIVAHHRAELAGKKPPALGGIRPSTRDFCHFIATQKKEVAVIAEIKRSTPFKGPLTQKPVDAKAFARLYEDAGAAAISVLTDEKYFKGSLADLEAASQESALPILRKDFIIDESQLYEARLHGADAVLLIARLLAEKTIQQFLTVCHHVHMRALVEVHDRMELDRALAAGARVIGINNRNLATGVIDLKTTLELAPLIPRELVVVSESGVESKKEIERVKGLVDAVLVGTALVTAADPARALADLVAAGSAS